MPNCVSKETKPQLKHTAIKIKPTIIINSIKCHREYSYKIIDTIKKSTQRHNK